MARRPREPTVDRSSPAADVYKSPVEHNPRLHAWHLPPRGGPGAPLRSSGVNFETWFQEKHPGIPPRSAAAVLALGAEGGTVPFIARYRKAVSYTHLTLPTSDLV